RLLLFGLALPLALVHLWLVSLSDGFVETFKRSQQIFRQAFAPQSLMIYLLGTPLFILIPYLLLIAKTPAQKASTEIAFFVARIVLALIFVLIGWLVTVGALKRQFNFGFWISDFGLESRTKLQPNESNPTLNPQSEIRNPQL